MISKQTRVFLILIEEVIVFLWEGLLGLVRIECRLKGLGRLVALLLLEVLKAGHVWLRPGVGFVHRGFGS